MSDNDSRRTRSRLQLVGIFLVAVISLGGAWLLFQAARDGALWGTTNKGTFVQPSLTAAELNVRAAGLPLEGGTWWLWVVPDGDCGIDCRDALHQLRQLHALLNRDASRVRRGLLTRDGGLADELRVDYPRLVALSGNLERLSAGIYVVDPIGNLVFHYPMTGAGEPVLDDLKRLLKVSQIG
ncbi:MAG: hypothetical protein RIC56_06220 [Pseudomonadales bacterium]